MEYGLISGFLELLFKTCPNDQLIDAKSTIILLRKLSVVKEKIYKTLINPQLTLKTRGKKSGKGVLTNKRIEFVPWKNSNTLVDRLKLLIA